MRRIFAALFLAFVTLWVVPTVSAPKVRTHTVARGNTLGKIAKRYRITIAALCHANDIDKRATIKIGDKLLIPPRSDKDGKETRKVLEKRRAEKKKKKEQKKKAKKRSKAKSKSASKSKDLRWHRVARKQNLGSIARRYNTSVAAIVHANDIKKKEIIHPGQMLIIPDKTDKEGKAARKIFEARDGEPPTEVEEPSPKKAKGKTSWKKYAKKPKRRGYINIVGRKGRSFKGYLVNHKRHVVTKAKKQMKRVLATRDGKEHAIDLRLLRLLADVSDTFGGRPIKIVSGYRLGSTSATSRHRHGKAIDFVVVGVPNTALRDYIKTLNNVGVGYYPNSSFIHMDVRKQWTYWIDYSGPGQRPRYGGFWTRRSK